MPNLFHRFSDFINTALFIALLLLAGETLCVRSALTDEGITIGHPRTVVVYQNAEADRRLEQLAENIRRTPAGTGMR